MFRVMNVLAATGSDKFSRGRPLKVPRMPSRMPDIQGKAAGDKISFPHLIHHTTIEFVLRLHYITSD